MTCARKSAFFLHMPVVVIDVSVFLLFTLLAATWARKFPENHCDDRTDEWTYEEYPYIGKCLASLEYSRTE
jgi:hypothetical protein